MPDVRIGPAGARGKENVNWREIPTYGKCPAWAGRKGRLQRQVVASERL